MVRFVFLLLIFFLSVTYIRAQDTIATVLFDKNGTATTTKENAAYYRKVVKSNAFYICYDYYINGKLKMVGSFDDKACTIKTDTFKYYYSNGQLKAQETYRNNQLFGKSFGFFEDGLADYVCNYKKASNKCVYYHRNGTISAIEEYTNDSILLDAQLWDPNGAVSKNNVLYLPPSLNGLEEDIGFKNYVSKKMTFPTDPQGNKLFGTIHFYITIDTTGKARWGDYYGFANPYLVQQIQRLVEKMPIWMPAIIHNRKCDFDINIVLSFVDE